MTTSPKSSFDTLSSLVKQKRQKSKSFRYTINFIISVGGTGILAAATYFYPSQHSSILSIVVFALVPTAILWWVVNIIQNYDDKAETYIQETEKYKGEMDNLIQVNQKLHYEIGNLTIQLSTLIQETAHALELYPPFRELLQKEPGQKKLIGHFLKRAVNAALCIWNISRNDFLGLAQEGIKDCKKCQIIHYGSLTELQQHPYLNDLQEKQARRIVILPKEYIEEMEDKTKVAEFLRKTGITPSYWIDEERFFEIAELTDIKKSIKLDDCVIFDEQLLLLWQHDRRIAMLSFKGEKVYEGILRAFKELELQLDGYPTPNVQYQFQQIAEKKI